MAGVFVFGQARIIHRRDAEDAETELSPQIKQMSAGNADVLVGKLCRADEDVGVPSVHSFYLWRFCICISSALSVAPR